VGRCGSDKGFGKGGVTVDMNAASEYPGTDYDALRPRLMRVAYRMLGSVVDAEDIVQEAFIRWMKADRGDVREVEAFLHRTVTRLCLDQIKSARYQRESYVGTWLPEPLVEEDDQDDITLPLMLVLERLSPLERAAFLLHDVFGMEFDEVALAIERDPAACRQLAARARAHVREARPRFPVEKQKGREIAEAFFVASRSGDMQALGAVLMADVSFHADGGGKRPALTRVISGFDAVMKALTHLATLLRGHPSKLVRVGLINGLHGFVTLEADGELQTTALEIDHGKIAAIYVMRNPDKLKHLH
jgi:RNA polymerase sigma-70 factor, ECF subfamily